MWETKCFLLGSELDPSQYAFYGDEAVARLNSPEFRAAVVLIGTSGIEFSDSQILFGYHVSQEREFKKALFRCHTQTRIILAGPSKIARTHGLVFDILTTIDHGPQARYG